MTAAGPASSWTVREQMTRSKKPVGKGAHERLQVALVGGDAAADAAQELVEVEVHADAVHPLGLLQIVEQHAAAAAQVEHPAAGFHPVADDLHVDRAFFDQLVHGEAGAAEEAAHQRVEVLGFEQERIVAEVDGELGVAGAFAGAQEREHESRGFAPGGKSQSLVKATHSVSASTGAKACSSEPCGGGQVEVVERARDVEVGVGVEAVDEALALVAQVALDLELHVEGVRGVVGRARPAPAELLVHALVGQVGDVRHHARDGQAHARAAALGIVAVDATPGPA